MARDLATVIRLRQWEVDEQRRALAEWLAAEQRALDLQAALAEGLKAEQRIAAGNPMTSGLTYGPFATAYLAKQEELAQALANTRARIQQTQDRLAETFKELKTFEIAQAARDERARKELARKDQMVLDEVALNLHRRQGKTAGS
ncbi:flagellar FliJ family protein [Roseospirillum parvum]|uniref:Flagellar FliJ protein n=1 Tax=Roseospirillum parvum TaxID=83401 RepID=A0A1G8D1Y3_9PROT|nr:flagellar FliJ family protein [Roseospirillum parvum]SDH51692.1 flagellar export protein FliJ [Roseospirillum parvum]